ncbi:T9SS type A sorting domain-containing protein [Ferruginibacter sp. SUN002]|uniref:T9SS type A sorting domain-containing protein n=1 Tax=Ferruginibacter sp. SUN002 TaxID=2937789 RepID=UPI003D35B6D1
MKTFLFSLIVLFSGAWAKVSAQCTFISPTVELNFVQTDLNGNCVVNFNLGFEIDINNGNKIIFLHLWRTQDYTDFNYKTQSQPKESNVLANAIATVIIDNDYLDNNPGAPATDVFKSVYGPDPGIDDNSGAAQGQVLDGTDGLTYNRVVVNASANTYRYTVNNLQVTLSGACSNHISFTGDAWSSNGNSASSSVQCTMEGYSFIVNDPKIISTLVCASPNRYSTSISTTSPFNLQFVYDIFVDNGDGFFDQSLDIQVVNGQGPYTITSGSPYNSGLQNYPAPYSSTDPWRQQNLWVRVRNMQLVNNTVVPPLITNISNSLLDKTINPSCGLLPINFASFTATPNNAAVNLNWQTATQLNGNSFIVERKNAGGTWQPVTTVGVGNYSSHSGSLYNYAFSDKNASVGVNEYRIRQVDADGSYRYSETRIVTLAYANNVKVVVYPNPSYNGKISVTFNTTTGTKNNVSLLDVTGRRLKQWTGITTNRLDIANLTNGVYTLVVKNLQTNEQIVKKVIVRR